MIHEGPLTWKVNKDKQIGQYICMDTFCIDTYSLISLVSYPLITCLCILSSEIQALLLSDCLVLLQRGPDDRLQLRYPSRWLGGGGGGSGDSKTSFSPLVKLDSLLVRSVATGKTVVTSKKADFKNRAAALLLFCGPHQMCKSCDFSPDNKALYIISTTERQIYELVAGTSSEKNT